MIDDLVAEDLDSLSAGDVTQTVKVLVIGNGHVGKTTYVRRFCTDNYNGDYKKTIGCDFSERRQFLLPSYGNKRVDVMVWDTAGQEEYRSLNHKYYDGAGCALLLFSITDKNSFLELPRWKNKVLELCGEVPMAIVQTKMDASDHAAITLEEVKECATKLKLRLFRISSMNGININEPFEYVAVNSLRGGGGNSAQQVTHISSLKKASDINGTAQRVSLQSGGDSTGTGSGEENLRKSDLEDLVVFTIDLSMALGMNISRTKPLTGCSEQKEPSYPAMVESVQIGSQADRCGVEEGMFIYSINGVTCRNLDYDWIMNEIQKAQNGLNNADFVNESDQTMEMWLIKTKGVPKMTANNFNMSKKLSKPKPKIWANRPTEPSRRRTNGRKDRLRQKNIDKRKKEQQKK
jgi:Ras-related protein Rab-23